MFARIKYLFGSSPTRPVFVVGTGRSGTHWLGYSLGDHPEVRATIETAPMFQLSTQMAMNPSLEAPLLEKLLSAYRWQLFKSAPRLYLDKSHPNLWIAEKLKDAFPKSLFVCIERNPYATVASMMKHKGVSEWHRRWREFPVPNRFLGITNEIAEKYDDMPFPSQCALRWVAHHERVDWLRSVLGADLTVISYEEFARDTEHVLADLQGFLGLRRPIPMPEVRRESLDKWRTQLSAEQIAQIRDVVHVGPDDPREQQQEPTGAPT